MILAGDIGGTKTLLEIGILRDGNWKPVFGNRYPAAGYLDLHAVLHDFLREWGTKRSSQDALTHACLGVAGPTFDNRAQMTNLPWTVDGKAISAEFDIPQVQIVNDFAAAASGIEMLQEADRVVLQPGDPRSAAPRLVIGAGTGLGVAYLLSTATGYRVIAGESGHAGFAPATPEQAGLWHHLYQRLGRVSVEDVVSGPGLVRIREYVEHTEERPEPEADHPAARGAAACAGITPAAIVRGALESGDPQNLRALDLFIACYGEVAGNCALALLARGGVYVAGGIAPKILPRLRTGGFLAAFNAKGPHSEAMRKIPVSIVTNERLGLLGCALIAARSQNG